MEEKNSGGGPSSRVKGVSRQKLVQNSKDKFYANLTNVYKANKDLAVLEAAPSTKKAPLPAKPTTGTFSRAGTTAPKPATGRVQRVAPSSSMGA